MKNDFNSSGSNTNNSLSLSPTLPIGLVSNEFRDIFENTVYVFTSILNVVGCVNNVINMRVFVRQGLLKDSTTFGLFTLSLYDLLGCFFLLPYCMCQLVKLIQPRHVFYNCVIMCGMSFAYSHLIAVRTAGWVTVYISVERALCVVLPMKVKTLFRPKTTIIAMAIISLFFIGLHIPLTTQVTLTFVFNPFINATLILPENKSLANTFVYLNNLVASTIMSSAAIIIVFITTILMINKLVQSRKWRRTANAKSGLQHGNNDISTSGNTSSKTEVERPKSGSGKDLDVIKTVLTVTSIYLVCLSMSHIPSTTVVLFPGVNLSGYNRNLMGIVYGTKYLFDAINSAANFFFYIRVSSRYKAAFNEVFGHQE